MIDVYRINRRIGPGSDSWRNGAPPSDTSTIFADFHTGSSPRLSYTPPSTRHRCEMRSSRLDWRGVPPRSWLGLRCNGIGSKTGGKHDDAATARATVHSGVGDLYPA